MKELAQWQEWFFFCLTKTNRKVTQNIMLSINPSKRQNQLSSGVEFQNNMAKIDQTHSLQSSIFILSLQYSYMADNKLIEKNNRNFFGKSMAKLSRRQPFWQLAKKCISSDRQTADSLSTVFSKQQWPKTSLNDNSQKHSCSSETFTTDEPELA